jgi:hypothetical protein
MIRAENKLYTLYLLLVAFHAGFVGWDCLSYMKAGVKRSWSCVCKASTIDVIIPAAWYAMVRDGYAGSSKNPLACRDSIDPAGGMCAL